MMNQRHSSDHQSDLLSDHEENEKDRQTIQPSVPNQEHNVEQKKYDHDAIFLRKYRTKKNLIKFFVGARKNPELALPQKIDKNEQKPFAMTNNRRVRLSSSILSFSSRYYNLPFLKKTMVAIIVAIIAGFFSAIFIQNTGLYMSGLNGTAQGIARLIKNFLPPNALWVYNVLFWGLIILINCPLFFFGYYKINREFAILTMIYVATANLLGFALSQIPGFSSFVLIGPSANAHLDKAQIDWTADARTLIGLLFAGIICSQLFAVVYTSVFTVNCSSGGFDFFSVWYSRKKHRNISKIFTCINCFSMFFGSVLGSYIGKCYTHHGGWLNFNMNLFTPNFLVSLLMIVMQGLTLNFLFPRFKWAKIEIYSAKTDEIRNILISDHHQHSLSIHKLIGGHSLQEKQMISITCLYSETPRLLSLARYIDENCLVTISDIKSIDGYVYIYEESSNSKQHSHQKKSSNKKSKKMFLVCLDIFKWYGKFKSKLISRPHEKKHAGNSVD